MTQINADEICVSFLHVVGSIFVFLSSNTPRSIMPTVYNVKTIYPMMINKVSFIYNPLCVQVSIILTYVLYHRVHILSTIYFTRCILKSVPRRRHTCPYTTEFGFVQSAIHLQIFTKSIEKMKSMCYTTTVKRLSKTIRGDTHDVNGCDHQADACART